MAVFSKKRREHAVSKKQFTQDWVPVKDINYEMIETKDGRYVRILEITPINFHLRNEMDKNNIVNNFFSCSK